MQFLEEVELNMQCNNRKVLRNIIYIYIYMYLYIVFSIIYYKVLL
jgi:hypothetical protein